MENVAAAGGGAPRVYLKLHPKRTREGYAEEAPERRYVRLQWSSEEMGPLPAPLHRALAERTKFVFRRLPTPITTEVPAVAASAAASVAASALVRSTETAAPSRTRLTRVTQAGRCLVIDCAGDEKEAAASSAASLFVLDTAATQREAMEEAFGEFAITEDDVSDGGVGGGVFKRGRDADDDVADVVLAPVRRRTCGGDHSDARVALPDGSQWGAVEADVSGTTWALLRAHDDELLCLESAGEVMAGLYCYPDHRKDDEYDSNAEDFSGNDYPNDADEGENTEGRSDASSSSSQQRHRGGARGRASGGYGMFCEEGYSERSLSSGWGSSDDGG